MSCLLVVLPLFCAVIKLKPSYRKDESEQNIREKRRRQIVETDETGETVAVSESRFILAIVSNKQSMQSRVW